MHMRLYFPHFISISVKSRESDAALTKIVVLGGLSLLRIKGNDKSPEFWMASSFMSSHVRTIGFRTIFGTNKTSRPHSFPRAITRPSSWEVQVGR